MHSLSIAALAAVVCTATLTAQNVRNQIEYRPTCARCQVTIEKMATFGSSTDPVLIGTGPIGPGLPNSSRPAADGRGRYYAAAAGQPTVAVFDASGKFLSSIGGPGNGPGEFGNRISGVHVGPGDSILVFHDPVWVSIFTPDLKFSRKLRLPHPLPGAVLPTRDGFILSANIMTAERVGQRFHALDREGVIRTSFGGSGRAVLPGVPAPPGAATAGRLILAANGNSFWATDSGYVLVEWTLGGREIARLELVDVPWMTPLVQYDTVITSRAARRTITRWRSSGSFKLQRVDERGRLWLTSHATQAAGVAGRRSAWGIEVLDPRSGALLISHPTDVEYLHLSGPLYYTMTENALGVISIDVWRIALVDGP